MIHKLAGRYCPLGLAALLSLTIGCGYHTAGHTNTIPESIHTIAIPAFINQSPTYKIEQFLTASVVQEMITRTNYHIVNSGDADATLHGAILSSSSTPLTYDSQTGRATSALVVVSISVSLVEKQGKVLYENPNYVFREQYEVSQDLTNFFEEDTPAFRRLSRDFAQTLVSNILEGF